MCADRFAFRTSIFLSAFKDFSSFFIFLFQDNEIVVSDFKKRKKEKKERKK